MTDYKTLVVYLFERDWEFDYIGDIYENDNNLEFDFMDKKQNVKCHAVFKLSEIIGYAYQI